MPRPLAHEAFKRKFVDKGKWLWPLHTRGESQKVAGVGRGWEEQLEPSLGKQIGIIYNLSDVKATTTTTAKTMLQKEAAKTFKQLNAHTLAVYMCEREREGERDTRTW